MLGKRKGMFGAMPQMPGPIIGIGGGTWNTDGTQATPMEGGGFSVGMDGGPDMPEAVQPQQKKGLFGNGFAEKLATIGAVLTGEGANSAALQPFLLQKQMQLEQQKTARQRETEFQDYVRKAEYDRANPKPINNDTVADYNFWKSVLSPEDFQKWQQNKIDPPQYRQGPDGQFYRINPSQQTPPAFSADDWNSGTPIKGGSGGNAGGGFR